MKAFLFFLLLFLVTPVYASDLFSEMLNQTYVNNASEMPVSNETPTVQLQHYKHISAWVDITGFKGEIVENNVTYIGHRLRPPFLSKSLSIDMRV